MGKEKRMIGDYTVLSSVNVGEKEIIIASNEQSTDGTKFFAALWSETTFLNCARNVW